MIERKELEKFGPPGFHLAQKEKDYVQHWILSFLSRSGFAGVFKGGTCLQKVFSLPRYSDDLDFTLNDSKEPDIDALQAFLSQGGFTGLKHENKEYGSSTSVRLTYQGPLYNGTTLSQGSVVLDFSKREKTVLSPKPITLNPAYLDLLPYQLLVMDKKEISAEKVRAILTRKSARDLFDLYFLFKQEQIPTLALVNEKLAYYDKSMDFNEFKDKASKLEKEWKKEINALTKSALDYETAIREVEEKLEEIR